MPATAAEDLARGCSQREGRASDAASGSRCWTSSRASRTTSRRRSSGAAFARAATPGVGLATVYRTLALLSEKRVVDALSHHGTEQCYRLCGDDASPPSALRAATASSRSTSAGSTTGSTGSRRSTASSRPTTASRSWASVRTVEATAHDDRARGLSSASTASGRGRVPIGLAFSRLKRCPHRRRATGTGTPVDYREHVVLTTTEMELGGLEPPTSWVRSVGERSRAFGRVR